jgi:hypothetical protein
MRRRRDESIGSLDSLLDTMTNVVGILVILLVVTQLGVTSAVKRIRSSLPEVSEQQYDEMSRDAEQALAEVTRLEGVGSASAADQQKAQSELALLEKRLTQMRKTVSPKKAADLGALRKRIEDKKKAANFSKKRVDELKTEIASVRAQRDKVDTLPRPNDKLVRIPDPRPAPPKAKPQYFVCRYGKVLHVDRERAATLAAKRISIMKNQLRYGKATLSGAGRLSKGKKPKKTLGGAKPAAGFEYDRTKVLNYFRKTRVTSGAHRLYVAAQDVHNVCWLTMDVSTQQGDTVRSVTGSGSRCRSILKTVKRAGNYAVFIVYPDSFEVYLKARDVAEQLGLPAGWTLFTQKEWNSGSIVPGIKLHRDRQPPPPDPNKKPAPPRPNNVLD